MISIDQGKYKEEMIKRSTKCVYMEGIEKNEKKLKEKGFAAGSVVKVYVVILSLVLLRLFSVQFICFQRHAKAAECPAALVLVHNFNILLNTHSRMYINTSKHFNFYYELTWTM